MRQTKNKRLWAMGALAALAALLGVASPASAAARSPWWQLLSGSRPANLQAAPTDTEVQEVKMSPFGANLVLTVEVGGDPVGCLGAGEGLVLCKPLTGFDPIQTAPQLEELLEGRYGEGVEVTGGPAPAKPLLITTPGRWVVPVTVKKTPLPTMGSGSVTPISEGSGRLTVIATNLGDARLDASSTPLQITDTLPAGLTAYGVEAVAGGQGTAGPVGCVLPSTDEVHCAFKGELPPYEAIEVEVLVALTGPTGASGEVTVSGGGAASKSEAQTANVSDAPVPFGLERFSGRAEEEGGGETTQAGRHPFQVTSALQFDTGRLTGGPDRRNAVAEQPALPRNTRVTFPAGFAGSAVAVKPCELSDFLTNEGVYNHCQPESAVGVASVTIIEHANFGLVRLAVPVFSLTPSYGEPARFGFMPLGVPVVIDTSVDPEDSYRVTGEVRNASQAAQVLSASLTLWGVPADPRHDASRGWGCAVYTHPFPCTAREEEEEGKEPAAPQRPEVPFLRMPTNCRDPLSYGAELEPWNAAPGAVIANASSSAPPPSGCANVPFAPSITSTLTSRAAESPTGLDFELRLPGAGQGSDAIEEAQPKRVEVTLPEGVTVNPSEAEGLAVCSPEQFARERAGSAPGEGCPEASKIGSITGSTPLIEEPLEGSLYIATPYDNPFESLIALYLVARVPERGIVVRQAGVVAPDPRTGRLVSTFDNLPQLPYTLFKLHFREGARAPLVTPPGCGDFQSTARFVPWSAQDPEHPEDGEVLSAGASTTIERGVDGGACPTGGAPFEPGFEAGALNNQAGAYSPFQMRLTRRDGDQDLTRFSARLPKGTAAKLASVEQCPDAAIAAAATKSGLDEKTHPSCPAGSQIGTVTAGAGVGSVLTYVGGELYLAGPLNGAPLSVVAVVPALAGPFDVGTVVTREALRVDPRTGEVQADGSSSDPIPHILAGIPLKVRDIRVSVDRPGFAFNPTSCSKKDTAATIWSGGADPFSSADDAPHSLSARFQAAGCRALGFRPKIDLRLLGGARRGAFPALRMSYRPRPGDANLRRFALRFPHSEFIEQGHFRTICTRVQFAAGAGFGSACPKGAVYGHVTVHTPLLSEPLTGPVFLRSSNHNLPDVVLALHGPPSLPIHFEVPTRIDSVHGGLRAIAAQTPDAPISRVLLRMQGGQKGLFVNSTDLCLSPHRASLRLAAQNGRTKAMRPLLRAKECRKAKRHRRHRHRHRG